jgi:DNA-directed RNA polymerase sigma subunit (sigma70/sigma32)
MKSLTFLFSLCIVIKNLNFWREEFMHKKHRILTPNDRFFINAKQYNNCALCAIEENGSMTQETISKFIGFTKMRISQIEKRALEKIKKRIKI